MVETGSGSSAGGQEAGSDNLGGARWVDLGDHALVLDHSGGVVHRLEGRHLDAARAVVQGAEVPDAAVEALGDLVDAGIVDPPTGWSRRKVLTAVAVAGIATFALPRAAAAQSVAGDELFSQAAAPSNDGPESVSGLEATAPDDEHGTVDVSWS
jgi:hypothetical protein